MKGIKKNIILLGLMLIFGIVFLGCELEDDGSMKLGGNHNDVYNTKENINVENKKVGSSSSIVSSESPAPWTEEYKTYYKKIKKKELKKIEATLKSTNTFWSYIKSKGYDKTNIRMLKGKEVVSMAWPTTKQESEKNINYYNDSKEGIYSPNFLFVDQNKNMYIKSYSFDNQWYLYIKKYDKNGKFIWSTLYTTNTGPVYNKNYFVLKSIYVDNVEYLYCYGYISEDIWGSSKGVKEYNKEGQLVKQGIVKKGYYVNSKGEKISELELIGRGYRKKYKLKRSFIINKSLFKWWLEIKIFNYQIKKQKFHSYVINRCGQFETFFIDKYGTTYCIYKKRKTNDMYFGNDFPIPNTYGYILIVSPEEKGGKLLGVVPIMNNGNEFSKKNFSFGKSLYITKDGNIYDIYSNHTGVHISKYSIYDNK